MLLSLRELEQRKIHFDRRFRPDSVDLADGKFRLAAELHLSGVAEMSGGTEEILVSGHIAGKLEGDCDRCLERTPLDLDRDFRLLYLPDLMDDAAPDAELEKGETEIGYYEGNGLRLDDVLREQILLWLPMHWVCSGECKGICPICGGNRNLVDCECEPHPTDDRWAALRNFHPSPRR